MGLDFGRFWPPFWEVFGAKSEKVVSLSGFLRKPKKRGGGPEWVRSGSGVGPEWVRSGSGVGPEWGWPGPKESKKISPESLS